MNILIYAWGENRSLVDNLTNEIRKRVSDEITIDNIVSPKKVKFTISDRAASMQALRDYETKTRECFFRLYDEFIKYDILILDPAAFYGSEGNIDTFRAYCRTRYAGKPYLIVTLDMEIEEIIRAIMQYGQEFLKVIPFPAKS